MGVKEGAAVGLIDGGVGADDGDVLGAVVGAAVGDPVGAMVVGSAVGIAEDRFKMNKQFKIQRNRTHYLTGYNLIRVNVPKIALNVMGLIGGGTAAAAQIA